MLAFVFASCDTGTSSDTIPSGPTTPETTNPNPPKTPKPPTVYTVTFDLNGGVGAVPAPITQSDTGASITLPSNAGIEKTGEYFAGWNRTKNRSLDNWHPGQTYTPTENITLSAFWATQGEHQAANEFKGSEENATILARLLTDFEYVNEPTVEAILRVRYRYSIQPFAVQELLYAESVKLTSIFNKIGSYLVAASGAGKPANARVPLNNGTPNQYNTPLPEGMDIGAVVWDPATQSVKIPLTGTVPAANMGFRADNGSEIDQITGGIWGSTTPTGNSSTFYSNFGANPVFKASEMSNVTYVTLSGILPPKTELYTIKQYNQSLELNEAPNPPDPQENIFDRGAPAPGVYKLRHYNVGSTAGDFNDDDFSVLIWKGATRKFATIYVTTYVDNTPSNVDNPAKVKAVKVYTVDWSGLAFGN